MKKLIAALSLFTFLSVSWGQPKTAQAKKNAHEVAIFAAGCFWCIQPPYDALKNQGVISTTVGYSGGFTENPTYEEVSSGHGGHREVIEVVFDPQKISYEKIIEVFWKNVDPFNPSGQFCDVGKQYTSAVYYTSEEQRKVAEKTKAAFNKNAHNKKGIFTEILAAKKFYKGEDYHQAFYEKNPVRYKAYKFACGREKRLKEVWER